MSIRKKSIQVQPVDIPACAGEVILNLVTRLCCLFKNDIASYVEVSNSILQIARSLIGASYTQVYVLEDKHLKEITPDTKFGFIQSSSDCFQSYVSKNLLYQIVNQAEKSSFLKSFEDYFYPSEEDTHKTIDVFNICAVPILNDEKGLFVLVFMYNKIDHKRCLRNFNLNDVNLIQAAGKLIFEIFNTKKIVKDLERTTDKALSLFQESLHLYKVSSSVMRREKCYKILQKASKNKISYQTLGILSICMNCSLVLLHVTHGQQIVPVLVYGSGLLNPVYTQTSEYTAFKSKNQLYVSDLTSEPLWNNKLLDFRSLISCPIVNEKSYCMGVVEFLHKEEQFKEFDKFYAQEVCKILGKISYNSYLQLISSQPVTTRTENLYKFTVSPSRFIDHQILLESIRKTMKRLIEFDKFYVYIINQNTNKCSILVSNEYQHTEIISESLIGDSYYNKKSIIVDPSTKLYIEDSLKYNCKNLMAIPVTNTWFEYPIIAVLLFLRSDTTFTRDEQYLMEKSSSIFSNILENFYLIFNEENADQAYLVPEIKSLESEFAYKSEINTTNTLKFLYQIDSLSSEKLAKISIIRQTLESSDNPLKVLAVNLSKWVPSETGALLLRNLKSDYYLNLPSETLVNSGGLIQQSFLTKSTIIIKKNCAANPDFNPRIDNLGLKEKIENILCVPVSNNEDDVCAVICLVNSPNKFQIQDIVLTQYLSLIAGQLLFNKTTYDSHKSNFLKEIRKNKILQQWFKQVFIVANSVGYRQELSKRIFQKLVGCENLLSIICCGLEIIKCITNSEDVYCLYKHENSSVEVYKIKEEDFSYGELTPGYSEIFSIARLTILSKNKSYENSLICPYSKGNSMLSIVCNNKKDETLTYYCSYTRADEVIIEEMCKDIFKSRNLNDKSSLNDLRYTIRRYAGSMNTNSLINTIRSAAQQLLDCDRGTVFIREGDFLVVKAQGIEYEIPVGLKVPIGKGIVGFVAQTGQAENIVDVYSDPRFNSEIDNLTGYKTKSMLCMPVIGSKGEVIAALQMINKRNGPFDKDDEESLEIFVPMVSSLLQNRIMLEEIIEERSRLMSILNSIGNYVLVLNSEGKLLYFNKQFSKLFGTLDKVAETTHYSSWLRFNRELVIDITSVLQKPDKKITRTAQRIYTQAVPTMFKDIKFVDNFNIFNYSISSLTGLFSPAAMGVIVILEDVSALQELNFKFNAIQNQLIALTNPVQTETALQRCINRLYLISDSFESSSDISIQLHDIANTLKQKNLQETEIFIPIELRSLEEELKSRLSLYVENNQPRPTENKRISGLVKHFNSDLVSFDNDITKIKNWNLDAFQVTDLFQYIRLMFVDMGLIRIFSINLDAFNRFLEKVKANYLNNPFHNFYHGFTVFHSSYVLLNIPKVLEVLNSEETLAIMIAALCHDVGHRGYTNVYEMNVLSDISITYNDKSVLENYHTSLAFRILQESDSNIISHLPREGYRYIRKIIIECILSTDMTKHFPLIANHTARFKEAVENPIGTLEEDCLHLACFIVHSCDIGHPTKELNVYCKWSKLVCEEFSNQYNQEIKNGLVATEFMKGLGDPKSYYKNEVGFLSVIVKPLWECYKLWIEDETQEYLDNLHNNLSVYQKKLQELSN